LQTSVIVSKSFLGQLKPTPVKPPVWLPASHKLVDPLVSSNTGAGAVLWRACAEEATLSELGIGYKTAPKPNVEIQQC